MDTTVTADPTGDRLRIPRKYNWLARSRFHSNRREALVEHLAVMGRKPTTTEMLLVEATIAVEWSLHVANGRLRDDLTVPELRDLLRATASLASQHRMNLISLGLRVDGAPVDLPVSSLLARLAQNAAQSHDVEATASSEVEAA